MNSAKVTDILHNIREKPSAVEHERWSHWLRYMHNKAERNLEGSLLIPAELVIRWERQMSTDYFDLDEAEKDSDREQVDKYIPIIEEALRKAGKD